MFCAALEKLPALAAAAKYCNARNLSTGDLLACNPVSMNILFMTILALNSFRRRGPRTRLRRIDTMKEAAS